MTAALLAGWLGGAIVCSRVIVLAFPSERCDADDLIALGSISIFWPVALPIAIAASVFWAIGFLGSRLGRRP